MDQNMPESYRMASDEVRRFFEEIKKAAEEFLQEHCGMTSHQAEDEVGELFKKGFKKALYLAMGRSWTVPVQPDWLIYVATCEIWFYIREDYSDGPPYPLIPVDFEKPEKHNGKVLPSPEHMARIQENIAKQATTVPQQAEPPTQLTAVQESMRAMASEWARDVRPIQVNQAAQGSQASSSAARGEPSSGGGTALDVIRRMEAKRLDNPAYNSMERSTVSTPTDVSEVSIPETQTIQEAEQDAEKKRADELANARKAIFKLSKKEADSDPVLNYRLDVPDADPEIMAILWDAFDVADAFPASEGFTCSGRPWEVKVHRSSAKMFFGDGFCDKDAIHNLAETPGRAQLYAHFEGEFLHIGVTTQKSTLSKLGERHGVVCQMRSVKQAFVPLAFWARNMSLGGRQSFTDYTVSVIREELASGGINIDKLVAEFRGEEVAAPSTSADEEEAIW